MVQGKPVHHYQSICNLSGLEVITDIGWENIRVGDNYSVSFKIIASRYVYTRVVGYSDEKAVKEAILFRETILDEFFPNGSPFIIIEDYSRLDGASPDSRKYFINYVRGREGLQGLIFVTDSSIMRMTISMGMKLYQLPFPVKIVRNYISSILEAEKISLNFSKKSLLNDSNTYKAISFPLKSGSHSPEVYFSRELPPFVLKPLTNDAALIDLNGFSGSDILQILEYFSKHTLPKQLNKYSAYILAVDSSSQTLYSLSQIHRSLKKKKEISDGEKRALVFYGVSFFKKIFLYFLDSFYSGVPVLSSGRSFFPIHDLMVLIHDDAISEVNSTLTQSSPEWQHSKNEFHFRYEVLDKRIPHCIVSGKADEASLDFLYHKRENFENYCRMNNLIPKIFVNIENLSRSNAWIHNKYIKLLNSNPNGYFDKIVFYGKNPYYRVFIQLAGGLKGRKLTHYTNLREALNEELNPVSKKRKNILPLKKFDRQNKLNPFIQEILNFIGSLQWGDSANMALPPYDQSHPLHKIFDALSFIKMDIDELFREKELKERALLHSKQQYKDIFDNVSDFLYFHDLSGKLIKINKSLKLQLGIKDTDFVNLHLYDIFSPEFKTDIDAYLADIKARGHAEGLATIQPPSGKKFIIEYKNSLVLENGEAILVRGSARDISQRIYTEKILRENLERYKAILENIEEGYYETDVNGKITFFNDSLCNILEINKLDVFFQDDLLYGSGEDRKRLQDEFRRVFKTHRPSQNFELNFTTQSGREKVLEMSIALIYGPKKMRKGFRGIVKDITDRKKAEKELKAFNENLLQLVEEKTAELKKNSARYQRILSNIQDGYYETDLSGHLLYANKALCEMTGIRLADIERKSLRELLGRDNYRYLKKHYVRVLRNRENIDKLQWEFMDGDGNIKHFENSVSVLYNDKNEAEGFTGIIRDITHRSRMEQELLEKKQQAEAANKAKSQFLANMSHEIRTPLNGIIGMSELANETALNESQADIFRAIEKEANSLLEIINEVLDYSKIEAGKMEIEQIPFTIHNFLEEIAEGYSLRAYRKNLDFFLYIDPQIPELLVGDPGKLRQILNNLMSNALKFTPSGYIGLTVKIIRKYKSKIHICFTISDTGIGIAPDKQRTIFESFTQEDGSMTRKYGGTGLGTTITKQLVDILDGTIRLKSQKGTGTEFKVTLSFHIHPNSSNNNGLSIPEDDLFKKILIVEDNVKTQKTLNDYFQFFGFSDIQTYTSKEFYEKKFDTIPDIIIFNTLLRQIESFGKIKHLQTFHPDLHVIYISPPGYHRKTAQSLKRVNEKYIIKPITSSKLHQILSSLSQKNSMFETYESQEEKKRPYVNDKPTTILLVEDYDTNRQVAGKFLSAAGLRVDFAVNGKEAVEMFQKNYYDLVLMDVQMPVMDGYQATREIRYFEEHIHRKKGSAFQTYKIHTPVIALTAHVSPQHRKACLAAGMDDVITKPFRRQELVDTVFQWLHNSGMNKSNKPKPSGQIREFDYPALLDEFDNDREFLDEIVFSFLNHAKDQIERIENAAQENNFDLIQTEAHALKGGAGNIMASSVWETAKKIEHLGHIKQIGDVPHLLDSLRKQLREFEKKYVESRKGESN